MDSNPTRRHGDRRSSGSALLSALASLAGISVITGFSLLHVQVQDTPPQQKPLASQGVPENLSAMSQSHSEFRRAVLAEFHRVAAKRDQQMDLGSLIVTSCNDQSMLAGVAVRSERTEEERGALPQEKEQKAGQEQAPRDRPDSSGDSVQISVRPLRDREVLGLVVVAGSFLTVRTREPNEEAGREPSADERSGGEREARPMRFVSVEPGFYNVRKGPRANTLELVSLEDRVAVTIPYRPGDLPGGQPIQAGARRDETGAPPGAARDGEGQGGAERDGRALGHVERDDRLDAGEWPKIYMELLHALDLGARR